MKHEGDGGSLVCAGQKKQGLLLSHSVLRSTCVFGCLCTHTVYLQKVLSLSENTMFRLDLMSHVR